MKVIVFAHRLEIGGTQTNAIELAAELRDRSGFDVIVHATPGPMLALVDEKQLRFAPAPDARFHPAPARIRALRALVRREQPDLVHAWDWWQGLEAYVGVHLPWGVPLLISDMMMSLTRVLPHEVPTTFGTEATLARAVCAGWRHAGLLLPPVDITQNAPGAADGGAFRRLLGIDRDAVVLVSVSRLAETMKAGPVEDAIEAVTRAGPRSRLTFVIVGDGEARARLAHLADAANRTLRRRAIILAGPMLDPRPAYDGADIVLGMGGSALRGLAFAKPVIVVGGGGYARLFAPNTAGEFITQGFYGSGSTAPDALDCILGRLAGDAALRASFGAFGRGFVLDRHSLEAVGRRLAAQCRLTAALPARRVARIGDAARTAAIYLRERRFNTASRDAAPRDVRPGPSPRLGPPVHHVPREGSRP
ncbi:glycosyltransferase family 4 protein [Acuticoccus kandeliae]|uniref:glycosyltransferase family 4 protein n=1 Tax=Acuticoccus kandeliae TaxID=2073160 RepID=UPI000D3E95EA|nr:glycosyltransferase family 4 protein [Acuticoccus kandeliae]